MDELIFALLGSAHTYVRAEPLLVRFETVEGAAGGGGGEGGGEGVVEPVADPAAVVDPSDPLDPAAAGQPDPAAALTREEIAEITRTSSGEAFREMLAEAERQDIAAREQQAREQQAAAANQLPAWDPFNPEVVAAHNRAQMIELLQPLVDAIQPALETTEQVRLGEGRDTAIEMLTGFEKEHGEFDHDRAILQAARYQTQGLAPEEALERAATEQAAFERKLEARGVEAWKKNAQNLGDQSPEPAGGSGAAAEVTQPLTGAGQRLDYAAHARASLARMGKGPGVGSPTG